MLRKTVELGVRGVMMFEIHLHTANQILHSGHYGNAAPNAAWDLVQLLATMRDPEGNCLVQDFGTFQIPVDSAEETSGGEMMVIARES